MLRSLKQKRTKKKEEKTNLVVAPVIKAIITNITNKRN